MKTLEEVKAHLAKVGYRRNEIPVIEGFLFGKDLYEGEEFEVEFIIGDNNFFDFKDWFDSEVKNKPEIDWSEFGFGDFIHVQDGIDVVLLGGIYDGKVVCFNGKNIFRLVLIDQSRPCNEQEIESLISTMNRNGIDYCFVKNEFVYKSVCCCDCSECNFTEKENQPIEELKKNYDELCDLAESISDDSHFKDFAKSVVESLGKIVEDVKEAEKNDSASIDMLEIDAKEAIENIIANIHAGSMDEKEKGNVISALRGLVELGNMYE